VLVHFPAVLLYLLESSYAHLQLGVSRAFGVTGTENFNHPFLATNPRTFWHRWNITLFKWLRDYVYKTLRGRRGAKYRRFPAILLTFIYCGVLHAPQWSAVAWGLWTGLTVSAYVVLEHSWGLRRAGHRPGRRPGSPWHEVARWLQRTAARLLVYTWFCIGIMIILDAEHYGRLILLRWLNIITLGLLPGP
jgi:D-alanyl-lipoteichoic acid acyltransferase DltB (MBOAT superfamily)